MANRVGQQLGNYRLLRLLGQGNFAAVYLGEHQYLERLAAIKVLHVRMESGTHEAFRREARTIAQLYHPHIIGVHDFGFEGDTPYLVMEYMPNGTLRSQYPKETVMPFEQIITFVKQIASALDYAHKQHVIHRDIKPENLLLGANHEVVLSDFGIAIVQNTLDSLSMHNLAGTSIYMAPEQIQGKPCQASDQYALGVLVYEWLCGEPPFHGPLFGVLNQHLHKPPPSLSTRVKELPPAVEDAIMCVLAKDPQQRFPCVADFASALSDAFFATQPLLLNGSVENRSHYQATLPIVEVSLGSVLSPSEQHHSGSTTQPCQKYVQRIDYQHEGGQSVSSQHTTTPSPGKPGHALTLTNRQRLLRRVRSFWITGVLEQSLHGTALIALGLETQPDAVANPWHLVLQHPGTPPRPLPTGTRITQVYDDADGELLILGAPGSGKTTLLLELARDLLSRAERDGQYPMPVVFNLSSWAMKQQPLVEWLIEEMNTKYQIPRKLALSWVGTDQVLPLLDGLDEVVSEARTACIEAINTYRQEHGLVPLLVCSRSTEYSTQKVRIQLHSAVVVQPLTIEQVDAYLSHASEQLEALRVTLRNDQPLQELVTTPLMLSILTLACSGQPLEDLLIKTPSHDIQQLVFATYVERMLKRRGAESRYTSQQTLSWLTWLAHQMKRHNQTQFFLERMQMDWLPKNGLYQLSANMIIGLIIGLIMMLSYTLAAFPYIGLSRALPIGLCFGLLASFTYLFLNGLIFGVLGKKSLTRKSVETLTWSWAKVRRNAATFLGKRWIYGPLFGIFLGLLAGEFGPVFYKPQNGSLPLFELSTGLFHGLLNAVYFGSLGKFNPEIQPAEVFIWTWANMRRNCAKFLGYGLLSGFVFGLSFVGPLGIVESLSIGLLLGLVFGSFGSFIGGLSSGLQDERNLTRPNQGIWRSARHSVFTGLVSGCASGLLAGMVVGLFAKFFAAADLSLAIGLTIGIAGLLSVGTIVGLIRGGNACIQHVLLRWHLWQARLIPWSYPHFLDYAAERLLLRKVGGGYIFIHRLLLEYFASLEEKQDLFKADTYRRKQQRQSVSISVCQRVDER